MKMVLSVITLAVMTPLLATTTLQLQDTAQRQQGQNGGLSDEQKTEKHHLLVKASDRMSDSRKEMIKDSVVVLRNGKVGSEPFIEHLECPHLDEGLICLPALR